MGDLIPKDERLLQGFVVGPPITDEEAAKLVIAVSGSTVTPEEIVKAKDALALIRQTHASYRQISKALCDKENATLEEVLQAVSQVKAELETVKRERDAAVHDLEEGCSCDKCWYADYLFDDEPCCTCIHSSVENFTSNYKWRGVCPENTEVQ